LLFDRYRVPLYNKALRLLKCHFRAEEAVADVFLKVWANRKALQTCLQLRAYLFAAVHNRCIDYLRKRRAEEYYAPEQLPVHQLVSTTPEQDMVSDELKKHLQEAINQLPPKGRTIFRLSREEGLTYSEIAEQLGISVKTVESHMRRSLTNLRHQFR
jgi:RNA polymerase sigma-70 factor (ECF subfamily)